MDKGYVQNTIFELLSRLGIGYEKLEHSPIITMKEGSEIAYKLGSTSCKNLFLCNKRQEYFMLMLPADKKLSAKNVARQIGSPHLSFASAEDMERLLHTYPGAVSVLSLIFEKNSDEIPDRATQKLHRSNHTMICGSHFSTGITTVIK